MKGNEYFVCTYTFRLQFLLVIESCCDLYKYGIFIDLFWNYKYIENSFDNQHQVDNFQNVLDYRSIRIYKHKSNNT